MIIATIRWLWRELLDDSGSPGAVLLIVVVGINSLIFLVMYKRFIDTLPPPNSVTKPQ